MENFESLVGLLAILLVPGIFAFIGVTLIWKAGKELYQWKFSCKRVMANCVRIQQIQEDNTTLYRPVFEYREDGRVMEACKLDYEYKNNICVGNMVPVTIERKHPDVVVEIGEEHNMAQQYVNVALGIFLLIVSVPVILSTILMYMVGTLYAGA